MQELARTHGAEHMRAGLRVQAVRSSLVVGRRSSVVGRRSQMLSILHRCPLEWNASDQRATTNDQRPTDGVRPSCYARRMLVAVAAVVLLLVGAALEVWAVIELGWRRAFELSDAPPDPAMAHLVFRGPFRFVRHPQSLGLLLILAGTALAVQAPLMWLLAVIAGGFVVAMAVR